MRDYAGLLRAGNQAQLEKLEQNDHKKGFDKINIEYAYQRLKDEVRELHVELDGARERNYGAIRHEAADCMNFLAMIILRCDQIIRDGE